MNFTAILSPLATARLPGWRARRTPARAAAAMPQRRSLPRHASLRLADGALELRVFSGCVWITRDGCPADWVLEAGDSFLQQPGAPVLVHALDDAELLLVTTPCGAQNG